MLKSVFKSKLVIMPVAAAVAALAVAVPAAASNWGAIQEGIRPGGTAESAVLKIRVEAGLPQGSALLPDDQYCPWPPAPPQYGGNFGLNCSGSPVSLTVENKSDHNIRITGVSQTLAVPGCVSTAQTPCALQPIASDRTDDGYWQPDVTAYQPFGTTIKNCGSYAGFLAEQLSGFTFGQTATKPLPVIPPHATLTLPTVSGSGLGSLHLQPSIPANCQGATFRVPLSLTGTPVTGQFS